LIEHPGRKDARHFQRWVESAGYAAPTSPEDVTAAMAEAVLFSEGLTAEWRGLLLTYLSLDQTIEGALNAIAMLDMDVVEMAGLDRYMHREFDLALPTRNESMKFVPDFGSLSPKSRQHILNEICKDDLVLYDTLVSHMEHGDDGVLRPLRDLVA
jgi:hypothetical protein